MTREYSADADDFAATVAQLLGDVEDGIEREMPAAAKAGGSAGKRAWSRNARSEFGGTGKYARSISHKEGKKGMESWSEVGSATMPGLPHLLEKGHATLGGGRVAGRQHIAPAAEEAFRAFEDAVDAGVDRGLG